MKGLFRNEGDEGRPLPIHDAPNGTTALRFAAVLLRNRLVGHFDTLFRHEEWAVGIVHRPLAEILEHGKAEGVRWIRSGARDRYLADPFGLSTGDGMVLLVEEFDYREMRGWIRALEVDSRRGSRDRGRVLPLPVHASYPYLLEVEGEIYCIPETGQAREVALFRALTFPQRWEKVGVLIRDFAAVDATIFTHEGRWWLLCADDDGEPSTHLYAWFAEDLEGPWQPHALNPLKSDISSARPAGTPFRVNGELYRPGQDCSRTYGGAVAIHRVDRLTPTEFHEVRVSTIAPDPDGPFPNGLHTLAGVGEFSLVDGKRTVVVPSALLHGLRRTLRLPVRSFQTEPHG